MTRVALVDQVGTGSGSFLRGLVDGIAAEAEDGWSFTVLLPRVDYSGRDVEWAAGSNDARVDVRLSGDSTGRLDGRDWIESELSAVDCDLAYFAYPYLASFPDLGVPAVATTHDFNHKRFDTWSAELRASVDRELPLWVRGCAALVVSSEFIAAELAAYYPEATGKTRIVRLGVPSGSAEARPPATAAGDVEPFLLTVGWVAPHKNQALIFRALKLLRERGRRIRLVLAGPNAADVHPERAPRHSYAWHLVRLAEAAGLESDADYVAAGYVSRQDLEALYQRTSALIMPTLYEAGSFPIREAVRLGCPVICSRIPALEEDVNLIGGAAQLVDDHDPEGLADAIEAVLADPRSARSAAAPAATRVETVFDWRRTARGYLSAFTAALGARAA